MLSNRFHVAAQNASRARYKGCVKIVSFLLKPKPERNFGVSYNAYSFTSSKYVCEINLYPPRLVKGLVLVVRPLQQCPTMVRHLTCDEINLYSPRLVMELVLVVMPLQQCPTFNA